MRLEVLRAIKDRFIIEDRWDAICTEVPYQVDPKLIVNLARSFHGIQGLRDPDHPCNAYDNSYGEPDFICQTDGHYMCIECRHICDEAVESRLND